MKFRNYFGCLSLLFLLEMSYSGTVYAQGSSLINVTQQDVKHVKDFWIGYFATGVPQVGERTNFEAPPGVTSFNHA